MRSPATVLLVIAVLGILGIVAYVATRPDAAPEDDPARRNGGPEVDPVTAAWRTLGHLINSDDEDVRAQSLEIVSGIEEDRVPRFLAHALEDSEALVQVRAAGLLALTGRRDLAPFIMAKAEDEDDWDVFREAAVAIGRIGTAECVPLLVKLLTGEDDLDVDEDAQTKAALWLARLGAREAIPALRQMLERADEEETQISCAAALLALGETDVMKQLEDWIEDNSEELAPALAVPGNESVIPILARILGDPDGWEDERGLAALSLADVGTAEARELLEKTWIGLDEEALKAGNDVEELRGYLAAAFARLGDDRGAAVLEKAAGTADEDLLVPVLEAAARLGKGVPVERLLELATTPPKKNLMEEELVRAWAARAILQRKE